MDQAFITMRELRFNSRATDGVRCAERRMRLSVMSRQPKRKLEPRTPRPGY